MTFEEKIKEKTILIYATEYVRLDDILALLKDYLIMRMQGATCLSGEKAVEEVLEWMHGRTAVDKQKLREFAELLKNRPQMDEQGIVWRDKDHMFKLDYKQEFETYFELLEKRFHEFAEALK